jgi:hypothetical protein
LDLLKLIPPQPAAGIGFVAAGVVVVTYPFGEVAWLHLLVWVFGLFLIFAGFPLVLKWFWDLSRRNFLSISVPENGWVFCNRDDNYDNPTCNSVVTVSLTAGYTDIEVTDFEIRRYKDGRDCGLDQPEMRVCGGDPVRLGPDYKMMNPVILKAGSTQRVSYRYTFFTPLLDHYRASQMQADGEIRITLKYRFIGAKVPKVPVIKFFSHVSTVPETQASIYKPIKRLSSPPRINDQIIRAAWWRGWINGDDRRFAQQFPEQQRFVAVVKSPPGVVCDGIRNADIDRLKRINDAVRDREFTTSLVAGRARDRFGGVGGTIVSAVLFLRGLVRSPASA